jgi:flavocytochrome c
MSMISYEERIIRIEPQGRSLSRQGRSVDEQPQRRRRSSSTGYITMTITPTRRSFSRHVSIVLLLQLFLQVVMESPIGSTCTSCAGSICMTAAAAAAAMVTTTTSTSTGLDVADNSTTTTTHVSSSSSSASSPPTTTSTLVPTTTTTVPSSSSSSSFGQEQPQQHNRIPDIMLNRPENTCLHIQDIEQVNTGQLYEILQHLKRSPIIHNLQINLQPHCIFSPLQPSKLTKAKVSSTTTASSSSTTTTASTSATLVDPTPNTIPTTTTTTTPIFDTDASSSNSKKNSTSGNQPTNSNNDKNDSDDTDSYQCSGTTVLQDELDDDTEPLCSIQQTQQHIPNQQQLFSSSTATTKEGSSSSSSSLSSSTKIPLASTTSTTSTTAATTSSTSINTDSKNDSKDGDDDDASYQCSGTTVLQDELDDDAEPLCSIQQQQLLLPGSPFSTKDSLATTTTTETTTANTKTPTTTAQSLFQNRRTKAKRSYQSNVLHQLQRTGFTSQAQQDTFTWHDVTDTVLTEVGSTSSSRSRSSSNPNQHRRNQNEFIPKSESHQRIEKRLPQLPTKVEEENDDDEDEEYFWKDMCSALWNGQNRHATMINLALNPERNTGYNGTHIWRAIYDENCIVGSNGRDNDVIVEEMCYEERVLYRLLSGLHSSTTISIAKHYYPPSKKKNRTSWEANPTYFMEHVYYNPEYIRNLHFTYVVLLRALSKASTFLYQYDFHNAAYRDFINDDNTMESDIQQEADMVMTQKLMRRLLDSSILQSCHSVFMAFDESLMFQEENYTVRHENMTTIFPNLAHPNHMSSPTSYSSNQRMDVTLLRQNFKGVFQNVSSILDCVQCQQCKLHGKLVMLGYGAALKILLHPKGSKVPLPELEHNEIVALINTVIKFSESIYDVRELTNLYVVQEQMRQSFVRDDNGTIVVVPTKKATESIPSLNPSVVVPSITAPNRRFLVDDNTPPAKDAIKASQMGSSDFMIEWVDVAVQVIATLGRLKRITDTREEELIQLVFQRDINLLILVKYYHDNLDKFLRLSQSTIGRIGVSANAAAMPSSVTDRMPDAIVVGSGLAGMATTLNMLDRGGRVVIIDKEHVLGGNSGKASSGINACCPPNSTNQKDSMDLFWNDTFRSAGTSAQNELITTLISKSADAVSWLQSRLGVDLSLVAQLGGHSTHRTHRPKNGMVGAEIIYAIQRAIKAYTKDKQVTILTDTKVTKLLTDDHGAVIGVEYVSSDRNATSLPTQLYAPNVVLATGGFASDRSEGSYLSQYRPELMKMPATAGPFSTGDGIKLALELGAATIDMDKVQVHPTGWVDPTDPDNRSKILAGELMRGVGGILLNATGQRFCNELGTRSYVTNKMLSHDPVFARTGNWSLNATVPTFTLLLSSSAAADGKKHVDLYTHKGLLKRLDGLDELAKWMKLPSDVVSRSLKEYQGDASNGIDIFGKQTFKGILAQNLQDEIFYAGTVTPVLHYCMGGISIDATGSVLNGSGEIIPGLHAAGEVSGGVHGINRLGGNSLLECTVYGTIVGQKLPIHSTTPTISAYTDQTQNEVPVGSSTSKESKIITTTELQRHNTSEDCWIAIHGIVYDMTNFAEEHPAGAQSIHELAGLDGTDAFAAVHNPNMLEDFDEEIVGVYKTS